MGCKSSRPLLRPQHHSVPFPHRGPQYAPSGALAGGQQEGPLSNNSVRGGGEEDTGYANPHDETVPPVPLSARDSRSRRYPARALSPHASDDDLVLVCAECGAEIEHCSEGEFCPVSGKRHT